MIVVQQIQYRMSKERKRQIGLAEMVRAPEAMRVPMAGLDLSVEPMVHHILLLGVRNASVPAERVLLTSLEKSLLIGGVAITLLEEQQVRMEFVYTRQCGAPDREWARQTFQVGPGEWAQVRYNGRFAPGYTDYWCYEKTVVNVGINLEPHETMFVDTEPTYHYSLMSGLK